MSTWRQRKQVGDAHEARVARLLRARGWTVAAWGQATLPGPIRLAIVRSGSTWRYFPDLVAARQGSLLVIDAKDRMPGARGDRYSISVDCLHFGMHFTAAFRVPFFYVFGDLGVLTPAEIFSYQFIGTMPRVPRDYYLIPASQARGFDDTFGAPSPRRVVAPLHGEEDQAGNG
jgi:hypothetical protein